MLLRLQFGGVGWLLGYGGQWKGGFRGWEASGRFGCCFGCGCQNAAGQVTVDVAVRVRSCCCQIAQGWLQARLEFFGMSALVDCETARDNDTNRSVSIDILFKGWD